MKRKLAILKAKSALLILLAFPILSMGSDSLSVKIREDIKRYRNEGKFDSAMSAYRNLERKFLNNKDYCEHLRTLIDIAEFNRFLKKKYDALKGIREAESYIATHPQCHFQYARLYNRYAAILAETEFNDLEVLRLSKLAIKYAAKTGDSLLIGKSYNEVGRYYTGLGNRDSSVYYYQKAKELYKSLKDTASLGEAIINIARLRLLSNEYEETIRIAQEALDDFENSFDMELRISLREFISTSLYQLGKYKEAYEALQEYHTEGTIFKEQLFAVGLAEAETKYQVLKKEKQIAAQLLLLSNQEEKIFLFTAVTLLAFIVATFIFFYYREQKRKNKRLKELLDENNLLTSELNHRVKNNFQLIVNIINHELRAENQDTLTKLSAVSKKIEALSALHRQLYGNSDKLGVDIKSYARDITVNFNPIFNSMGVEFTLEADSFSKSEKFASYLGLLITELITNSLKHAFKGVDNPKITLKILHQNDRILIHYHDNGNGLTTEEVPQMISILCQQLQGKIEIKNKGGFNANFEIPC